MNYIEASESYFRRHFARKMFQRLLRTRIYLTPYTGVGEVAA